MTLQRGDVVRVENERNKLTGTVELVSENQQSIAVTFEGDEVAIHDSRGGMLIMRGLPLLQGPPDVFTDLLGDTWTVKKRGDGGL